MRLRGLSSRRCTSLSARRIIPDSVKLARRLDRYVISEVLGPLVLGFLIYTFIILAQFLLQSAEMIVRRGVPAGMVGRLLLLSLPNIVVLTVPMSFLFAILVAVGRFSADSELIAMRSSGVSLLSLYRPILLLSLVLTIFNTYLMVTLLPAGNNASIIFPATRKPPPLPETTPCRVSASTS